MKSRESANETIYGDASIINYGFIIIAPKSRDGARFARRRDSFNDAASRMRTTTCAHPRSSPPHPGVQVKLMPQGSLIYHCIRFRTCSGPFIAACSYIPSKVTRGMGYESCNYIRVRQQWRRCGYIFVGQIARIESSMILMKLDFRLLKIEETD